MESNNLNINVNNNDKPFPEFYSNELVITQRQLIFWRWATIIGIVFCILTTILIVSISEKPEFLYIIVLFFPFCIVLIANLNNKKQIYKWLNTEAKTIVFDEKEKTISINIKKLYRKLRVAYININWTCVTLYVLYIFSFFIWSIICLFTNKELYSTFNTINWKSGNYWNIFTSCMSDLGSGIWHAFKVMITPNLHNGPYFLIFIIIIALFILTLCYHPYAINKASTRINAIDNYYGDKQIVTEQEIAGLKRKAFWFGFFIFAIVTIFLIFITFKIWKKYRSSTATPVAAAAPIVPPII